MSDNQFRSELENTFEKASEAEETFRLLREGKYQTEHDIEEERRLKEEHPQQEQPTPEEVYESKLKENASLASREGTMPKRVLGARAAKLCTDFIDFATDQDFQNSVLLEHNAPDSEEWSIRGYGIGNYVLSMVDPVTRMQVPTQSPKVMRKKWGVVPIQGDSFTNSALPYNVFLCEDNKLRTFTRSYVETGLIVTASPQTKTDSSRAYTRVINDLPRNERGRTYPPLIGAFTWRTKSGHSGRAPYVTPGVLESDGSYPDGGGISSNEARSADTRYLDFKRESLKEIFLSHADDIGRLP